MAWKSDGVWEPSLTVIVNETQVDPQSIPMGMYLDEKEICQMASTKKGNNNIFLLPIYRSKSKEFHEEVSFELVEY